MFFKRTEKENINSDAKANFQMAHENAFFFFVIHFVNITRQLHSVNIYTIQYSNHRKIKRKPPCNSFLSVFLFFHSRRTASSLGRILWFMRYTFFFLIKML